MKQNEILFFLGSVCIVIFAWIAFSVLHNSLTSTISGNINQIISPIQSTFDSKVIDAMNKRTVVLPLNTIQPPSQTEIIVTSAPTPTPSPTPGSLTSESASGGGSLQ